MLKIRILLFIGLFNLICGLHTAHAQSVIINLDVFGLNVNQFQTGRALELACNSIDNLGSPTGAAADLLNTCALLNPLDDEDPSLAAGLDRLLPEEAFAISDTLTDASDLQVTNVNARINALRKQQNGSLNAQRFVSDYAGGGAAAPRVSNMEAFVTGQISNGDVDGRQLQQDADLSASQMTLGADYRLSNNLIVGVGLGLFQNKTNFRTIAGGSEVEGKNVTFYSTYAGEGSGYLDVVVDIGSNQFDLSRQINIGNSDRVLAVSSPDSTSATFTMAIGRNFQFSSWDMGPYIRTGITTASVDAYSEKADSSRVGFGSTLRVGSQTINSTTLSLGATVTRVISMRRAVLVPQLNIEAEIETDSDKDPLNAYFLADPDQQVFTVRGETRDTSYANLGLGTSAVFANGKSAFAYFETRLAHDSITQHWFKVGARFEF